MKLRKRIISLCLVLSLLFSLIVPTGVSAKSLWDALDDTVSMSNKYIKVVVNKDNGRFAIRTVDGQPLRKNDQNSEMTFDGDDTSFTTFRITEGGYTGEYIFGNGYDLVGGNNLKSALSVPVLNTADDGTQTIITTWTLTVSSGNVSINQLISLSPSESADTSGMVFVDYVVNNNTSATIELGTRVLLDTMVGTNDGPAYQNGTVQENVTTVERTLLRSVANGDVVDGVTIDSTNINYYTIQNYFMMRDNGSFMDPLATSVYAYGFNNVAADDVTPQNVQSTQGNLADKIIVGHWAHLANSKYGVTVDSNLDFTTDTNKYGTADSAVAYYWNDKTLGAGQSRSYRVVYGLGEILNNDSEFQISFIDQKNQLETNDAKTEYLNDGIFDITVQVQCSESSTLQHEYVTGTLTLQDGLSFVETKNGRAVYEDGKPKTLSARSQTSTYTKSKTSVEQDVNYFTAGDMCVFKYKVVASGKAWPTTKEYMIQVTSPQLKASVTAGKTNSAYATQETCSVRSDFILLPAIGEIQPSRAYALAPEQAYTSDEKIISVGITNFGAYAQGDPVKDLNGKIINYPNRNFDVYLKNILTGDRYLVHPADITLVDKDGASGIMNIDYTGGTAISADNANPYAIEADISTNNILATDPTVPIGKYAVEVYYKDGGDRELQELLSFVSSAQIDVNTNKESRLRTGGYLTVARRYRQVSSVDYEKYLRIIDALNYAGQLVDDDSVQYQVQTGDGKYVPYYDIQVHTSEAELEQYKKDINNYTEFNKALNWTTAMPWTKGEVLLEIKGKIKATTDGYIVDTSVEPAVINRTITYTGTTLTLNSEILTDSFKNNHDFVSAYASRINGGQADYNSLSDAQKGVISANTVGQVNDVKFVLNHWTLAGDGPTSISGSKYTFYNKKWNIDFFDGLAKTLFLNDRIDEYSDRFDDSNVYNVSNLTASQAGYKEHLNGLVSEQKNPLEAMAEGDVYFNQLGMVPKKEFNPGGIDLTLVDYRLGEYNGDYRVRMGGFVNFSIFEGSVDDVSYDSKGFYGVDANCGFDIWKNIGILKTVGDKYYSEGYDDSKSDTTNQIASSGRAAELGAALLIRHYRFDADEIDNIYAFSAKFKLPVLGGFYVGFTFKEVDNGMILPDCYAFQYFAKSDSKSVIVGPDGALTEVTKEMIKEAGKEGVKDAQRQSVPGIPLGPDVYATRVRAAVRNLADTVYGLMTGENVGSLPLQLAGGITVSVPMGLGSLASRVALIGNIDMLLKMTGLKITGSLELEVIVLTMPLINMAEFQIQWSDPSFVSAKVYVDIFDLGIVVGKGSIFIGELENGDFNFDGYISAAVMIPKQIPVVGGLSLSRAYFGVNLERITGGFNIIPFVMVNLEYYWGGGIDDINFWIDTDSSTEDGAIAYMVHTDEETGQQSVLAIGKNMAYVATSDYDPETTGQKLVYRSTEGNDDLLIYRSAGLGGISVNGTTYTVPIGEKVYNETSAMDALVEMEYFDDIPDVTSAKIGGKTYNIAPYSQDTEGNYITPSDEELSNTLYYFTQESDLDGTTQKMMYISVPYEKISANSVLELTLDKNVDMALLRIGRSSQLKKNSVKLTQSGNSITMSAEAVNAKSGDEVKFYLTPDGDGDKTTTETVNGKTITVDDMGSMGMLVGNVTINGTQIAAQTATVTINNINDCAILEKEHVNLNELLESGQYYLRAVLDSGSAQDVQQTANYITLIDHKAPKPVTDAKLELGGNGQLKVSFKPAEDGNIADAFVLNFYDKDGNDYAYYTDLLVNKEDLTDEGNGVYSYTLGTWTEQTVENTDEEGNVISSNATYSGFKVDEDYKAKIKAVCSEELDDGTKYHYSALTADYTNIIHLPKPTPPKLTLSGAEKYYKHGDGDYSTEVSDTFAYYSLLTNKKQPEITIKSDVDATLKIFNGSEPFEFCVDETANTVTETTLKANTAKTIRLADFDGDDSTANFMIFARNEITRDTAIESMRVVTDYTAPTLYIDTPASGDETVNGVISFSGITNATDSTVTVYVDGSTEGTVLNVDNNGNFSGNVAVNTKKSTAQLRVVAQDAAGNSNAAEITVKNGGYEVAQNIVLRSYKSGQNTKVEAVGRYAAGKVNGIMTYTEKVISSDDVDYSTYRGDVSADKNGTVKFGTTDSGIIEATYLSPDGAKLTAMTVVRKDNSGNDSGNSGSSGGSSSGGGSSGGGSSGGGSSGGDGGSSGGSIQTSSTIKADDSKTTVNSKAVGITLDKNTDIVTIDASGSGEKSVKTDLVAVGYAIDYTQGNEISVDTPIFKANLTENMLGESGKIIIKTLNNVSTESENSTAISGVSVEFGGRGDLKTPVNASIAVPDTVSVNDITAVILRDKNGTITPLPFTLNMIGDKAYMDILITDEGDIIFESCKPIFSDVNLADWSYNDIMSAAEREILSGMPDGTFDCTADCTRSMFAAILMRTGGMMTQETNTILADVSKDAWDYKALAVAKDLGVLSGYSDGTMRGGNSVSRFEALAMADRLLSALGIAEEISESDMTDILSNFSDAKEVPDWAIASTARCINSGIIYGMNGGISGNVILTREQCAAISNRIYKAIADNLVKK